MLRIENDGPKIVATNFWETDYAKRGIVYVSVNAGAFRILLPPAMEEAVEEMKTAEYVIVTRGTWYPEGSYPRPDSFELLFEDHTNTPYAVHLTVHQIDRIPTESDEGRTDLRCLVYTQGPALRLELPARYRRTKRLPHLKPWPE